MVLKGGNALKLVYEIGERASVDLDYSLKTTFADQESVRSRVQATLTRQFRNNDLAVFDVTINKKPAIDPVLDTRPTWATRNVWGDIGATR